ncbi:MAG: hypothetical protein OEW30_19815, partial [Acidimicrobiia bacterium]|nr:hypothetical protein [Acidimicrobiia bacterium]
MIIRSRASVSIMLVLLIGLAASCGGDGIGNVLPGGSTLPGDGSVESPSPSEPSDTQPPDTQPPDTQPP